MDYKFDKDIDGLSHSQEIIVITMNIKGLFNIFQTKRTPQQIIFVNDECRKQAPTLPHDYKVRNLIYQFSFD